MLQPTEILGLLIVPTNKNNLGRYLTLIAALFSEFEILTYLILDTILRSLQKSTKVL